MLKERRARSPVGVPQSPEREDGARKEKELAEERQWVAKRHDGDDLWRGKSRLGREWEALGPSFIVFLLLFSPSHYSSPRSSLLAAHLKTKFAETSPSYFFYLHHSTRGDVAVTCLGRWDGQRRDGREEI